MRTKRRKPQALAGCFLTHEDGQRAGASGSQLKPGVVAQFGTPNKQITTFKPDVLTTEFFHFRYTLTEAIFGQDGGLVNRDCSKLSIKV